MDEHPLIAPLIESVQVHNLGLRVAGYDVTMLVSGGEVELGIMADAFDVDRQDGRTGFHSMGEPYRGANQWWRQGYFTVRWPDGAVWHVTVSQEVEAPVPSQDCGNCDGGHTGDAYCSQSTAGLLYGSAK
jgi:hypothetical protein